MKLIDAREEHIELIKKLYHTAFPVTERKPFFIIEKKRKEGKVELLAIEDPEFCGFAVSVCYKDMVLLDYFAISDGKRGAGVGTKAFQLLKERYKQKRFFLEIESTKIESDDHEQRFKRKNFYLKNDMTDANIFVVLFGVEMELLTDGSKICFEEYHELYVKTFSRMISKKVVELPS